MSGPVAIILAAGVGSRLRPLTDDRPKCLVPVGHETIVHRMVRLLAAQGVSRFVVSTGYLEEVLREALMEAPRPVTYVSNPDYASTQNVVSLHRALAQLEPGEAFMKLDGDVLFDEAVIARALTGDGDARVIVETSTTLGHEEMKVRVDAGRVSRFGKGIDPKQAHGESIGIEWFAADAARRVKAAIESAVKAGRTDLYYEDVYNDVLGEVFVRPVSVEASEWMEVDDVEDLERARRRFG